MPPIGNGGLGLEWDAVVTVFDSQAVPMHGGFDVAVVLHLDRELGPLIDVQHGTRDRAVVGEHAQDVRAEALANRGDAEVDVVAVAQSNNGRACDLGKTFGISWEIVVDHRAYLPYASRSVRGKHAITRS